MPQICPTLYVSMPTEAETNRLGERTGDNALDDTLQDIAVPTPVYLRERIGEYGYFCSRDAERTVFSAFKVSSHHCGDNICFLVV